MSKDRIQRASRFQFPKSIVGKVGLIMAMMTLCASLLSVSTYIMHDTASSDTTRTSRVEIPSALLSVSMLRYAGEMNRSILSYALGENASLETYYRNKNQFEVSLNELHKLHGMESSALANISMIFNDFVSKIEAEVTGRYDPAREVWAKSEKMHVSTVLEPELFEAIQSLTSSEVFRSRSPFRYEEQLMWLLREDADDISSSLTFYINGDIGQKEKFYTNHAYFNSHISYLQQHYLDAEIQTKLNTLRQVENDMASRIETVIVHYNPARKQEAIRSLKSINNDEYKTLESSLTEFSRETSFSAANSMANLHNVLKNNQFSFFSLFVIMTLVSVLVTFYIYKKVTQPIARLAETMRDLADGNTEIPILYKERTDEVGQISHAINSFRDHIISRNQAREQLLYQKELAESASKAKAQFLAAMSHEIRTPMNGVIGMIDILRRSKLDAAQISVTNTVRDSALSLLAIINDILDFSRIEAGKMRIDSVTFSLRHITEQVMDNLAMEAAEKNVSLTLFIAPSLPTSLIGDPTRIKQILFNLIGNGIKFSGGQPHRGEVQVWVNSQLSADGQCEIDIEIRDNGIGISKDKLQSIFRPFTQAEHSTTRRYGGSGLGLAISRNIASLMGGRIEAESEEGIGSTFSVQFKLPQTEEINAPEDCTIEWLQHAAKSLDKTVCINTLENGALKVSIDNYLQAMNLVSQSISVESLHLQQFDRQDVKYVILCRDYLQTRRLMPAAFPNKVDIRYLELDRRQPVKRYGGIDVFAIYASPLKLSTLLRGLRICVGLESPDYPALDTSAREAFIERSEKDKGIVLVAEDNVTNQTVIKKQLTYLGYDVVMTADGQEALRAYRKQAFTLVLTDCHMPNMDGYELTHAIRAIQKERSEFVPIIALTANALVGEAERCIETGMNDFIAKPVEIDVIQKVLSKWSQQSLPFEEPKIDDLLAPLVLDPEDEVDAQPEEAPTRIELDPNVLQKLFWGDEETYAEVLLEFLKHCVPELTNMVQMGRPFDYAALKATAHKLKTSSRSIGAIELSDLCFQIEQYAAEESDDVAIPLSALREDLNQTVIAVRRKHLTLVQSHDLEETNTPNV
ncbi:hybrid sensor histidine kinase/response regulator [Enterovibrio paralichthyis]|uniref:hybrid sensor histidine kinase/response regulator n=1 Tax=Enterovibrio paralichthyis TaxID=2853805 RepID=UPI001C483208|nr:hybrid sensor histidine kinase/response regulator [Enterovibrio paralichthyis]MBV7296884.1 response regulator [Enterovibrio paralichthyis]